MLMIVINAPASKVRTRISCSLYNHSFLLKKALIEKATREGWEYWVFEEKESTRKTRPIKYELYQRLLSKDCDCVCVWKIDRWARSTQELSREVTTLFNKSVKFLTDR